MNNFERGNRVKIINGNHKGSTGYVIEAFEPDNEELFDTSQCFLVRLDDDLGDIKIHENSLVRDTSSEAIMEETMYLTEKANAHNPEFKIGDVVSAPAPDDPKFKELYVVKECIGTADDGTEYQYKASPVREYLSHLEKVFTESDMIYRWYDKELAKKFTESADDVPVENINNIKKKFNSGDKVRITGGKEKGYIGVVLEVEGNKFHDNQYVVYLNETRKHSLYGASMMESVDDETFIDSKMTSDILFKDNLQESLNESLNYTGKKKALFSVGDVVNYTCNPNKLYVIKETIEDGIGNFIYNMIPLNGDEETCNYYESLLEFQYHDSNYEQYLTESVENGLPKWRGHVYDVYTLYVNPKKHTYGALKYQLIKEYENDTLPPERMQHVLHNHGIYDRIDDVLKSSSNIDSIAKNLGINREDVYNFGDSIQLKINKRNLDYMYADLDPKEKKFTQLEYQFVGEIDKLDRKDHYPVDMTNLQIMQVIKEAYSNANKIGNRKFQSSDNENGKSAPHKGKILYEGISKNGMMIQFWYNFDWDIIETAYPVTSDRSKKH